MKLMMRMFTCELNNSVLCKWKDCIQRSAKYLKFSCAQLVTAQHFMSDWKNIEMWNIQLCHPSPFSCKTNFPLHKIPVAWTDKILHQQHQHQPKMSTRTNPGEYSISTPNTLSLYHQFFEHFKWNQQSHFLKIFGKRRRWRRRKMFIFFHR